MPKRHNEQEAMIRPEPFTHKIAYDANLNAEYEGWTYPGGASSSAVWMICKHTYDDNNNLTDTQWADGANFTQIFDNRVSLNYS